MYHLFCITKGRMAHICSQVHAQQMHVRSMNTSLQAYTTRPTTATCTKPLSVITERTQVFAIQWHNSPFPSLSTSLMIDSISVGLILMSASACIHTEKSSFHTWNQSESVTVQRSLNLHIHYVGEGSQLQRSAWPSEELHIAAKDNEHGISIRSFDELPSNAHTGVFLL